MPPDSDRPEFDRSTQIAAKERANEENFWVQPPAYAVMLCNGLDHRRLIAVEIRPERAVRKAFRFQLRYPQAHIKILRYYPGESPRTWTHTQHWAGRKNPDLFAVGHEVRNGMIAFHWATCIPSNIGRWIADNIEWIDPRKLVVTSWKFMAKLTPREVREFALAARDYRERQVADRGAEPAADGE